MISQVTYLWIVLLCVTAGSTYSEDTELEHKGNESDGAIDPNDFNHYPHSKTEAGVIDNGTDLAEPATLINFTSTDATVNNTLSETMSKFVSEVDKNETETSQFASKQSDNTVSNTAARTVATTELFSPKKRTDTSVTKNEGLEASTARTVTELSTATSAETTEEPDECEPDNCTSSDSCIFTKASGCIRLRENIPQEKSVSYIIMVPHASSLISVEMEPEDRFPESNIAFEFEECERTQAKWEIQAGQKIKRRIYISRGSSLTLHIITDKSWINSTLRYRELDFEVKEDRVEDTVDEGVLVPPMLAGIRYRPSTQVTYLLTASKTRWNESSVMMTITFVDLDEGDYLVVGAGKNAFVGPKPIYFTGQISKSRNYYIACDDVYVRFESGASQKVDKKGFHIKWKRRGTAITKPDEEPEEQTIPDYIIQSVGICFYNISLIDEFNKTEDYKGPIQKFREKLASVANSYAKQKFIKLDSVLTASYVEIFRVSSVIQPIENVMPDGGLYVMVSIVHQFDRKTAVFRRHQLEEIIDQLDKKNEESEYSMLGFRVGLCPAVTTYLEWYIAAAVLLVVSTIALIVVWICSSVSKWRGYMHSKKTWSGHSENTYCKEPEFPARENDYIRYTPGLNKPKLKLTTYEGDTITLDCESLNQSRSEQDDGPDRVLFHQDWIMKERPSSIELSLLSTTTAEIEPSRPFLKTFAAVIPSTRKKNSDRMWMNTQLDNLLPQKSTQPVDHEYDSLIFPSTSASSTTCLVNNESDTRL